MKKMKTVYKRGNWQKSPMTNRASKHFIDHFFKRKSNKTVNVCMCKIQMRVDVLLSNEYDACM